MMNKDDSTFRMQMYAAKGCTVGVFAAVIVWSSVEREALRDSLLWCVCFYFCICVWALQMPGESDGPQGVVNKS